MIWWPGADHFSGGMLGAAVATTAVRAMTAQESTDVCQYKDVVSMCCEAFQDAARGSATDH
jgi:hypothetical protein